MKKIIFCCKAFIIKAFRLLICLVKNGQTCAVCGSKSFFYPVCNKCARKYFTLPVKKDDGAGIKRKTIDFHHVDENHSLFSYRLWNKELLFLWKIESLRCLSSFFAAIFARNLRIQGMDFIVPVPPRPGKIQKKGWDQIDETSSYLECIYGFKVLRILERVSVIQQKKLKKQERIEQTQFSYRLIKEEELNKIRRQLGGRLPSSVCIIDDVCTTGSTLENCARLLKTTGEIEEVYSMTLFIVD